MTFMSVEQVRAVRLKDAKKVHIASIDKTVHCVKMSARAALESQDIIKAVREGKLGQSRYVMFMLEHGLADERGDMLKSEDVSMLFDLIEMDEAAKLLSTLTELVNNSLVKAKTVVVEPGEG